MALGAPRVSSENGGLQSTASGQDEKVLLPRTLGEGDAERVDTSRGKDGAKVESKWKENKGRKSEEKRRKGLEKRGAGGGRQPRGEKARGWPQQQGGAAGGQRRYGRHALPGRLADGGQRAVPCGDAGRYRQWGRVGGEQAAAG